MAGSNRNQNQAQLPRAPSSQRGACQVRPSHETSNRSQCLSTTAEDSAPYAGHGRRPPGRPFNPQMDSTRYSSPRPQQFSVDGSSCLTNPADSSQQSSTRSYEFVGRPFNPLMDLLPNRQAANNESRLTLECEMAKSKDKALERLRREQRPNCDPHRRAQMSKYGRPLDVRAEIERERTQQQPPNEFMRRSRSRGNFGRPLDIDRAYDYFMPVGSPVGPAGRPFDAERDLTYRRLNLPTPKQARPPPGPSPQQRVTPHSSVQRVPKLCPRPAQPVICIQSPPASPANRMRYSAPSMQPQVGPTINTTAGGSRGAVTTVTTTAATRGIPATQHPSYLSPPQASYRTPSTSPARSAQRSQTPHGERVYRQDSTNISAQMDAGYGLTPPGLQTSRSIQTPARPLYVTDQFTNTSLRQTDASVGTTSTPCPDSSSLHTTRGQQTSGTSTGQESLMPGTPDEPSPPTASPMQDPSNESYRDMQRLQRSMDQTRSPRAQQPQMSQTRPTEESHYYNASMFDEPSHYRRQPIECPPNDYIDLTEETQCECNEMDISEPDLAAPCSPPQQEPGRTMLSWTIPSEDLTCADNRQRPDGTVVESTEYRELPSSLGGRPPCPTQMEVACEQPRASLFRCLAQKLSSTYNFLSSFVSPQRSAEALGQPSGQVCEAADYGPVLPYNADRPREAEYDFRNILTDETASNAKRCGRVQFDSSDRQRACDPHRRALQRTELENLVYDAYCPGIIQDTVDGRDNFNDHSFSLHMPLDPAHDPMTLIEAFSKRIEKERAEVNKDVKEHCNQQKVSEIVQQYFANLNPSDLNRSIKSLLLSERLQDCEQIEKSKSSSWEAEVQKGTSTWPHNMRVKIITYTGRTQPKANK